VGLDAGLAGVGRGRSDISRRLRGLLITCVKHRGLLWSEGVRGRSIGTVTGETRSPRALAGEGSDAMRGSIRGALWGVLAVATAAGAGEPTFPTQRVTTPAMRMTGARPDPAAAQPSDFPTQRLTTGTLRMVGVRPEPEPPGPSDFPTQRISTGPMRMTGVRP